MSPTIRQRSAILAIILLLDLILFGIVPIFQVLLIMTTNLTVELQVAKVTESLALAVFCIASCYWVWQRQPVASYLLLAGITLSAIIAAALKITVLRDERVIRIDKWTLVQSFLPALCCLLVNWVYFLRANFRFSQSVAQGPKI